MVLKATDFNIQNSQLRKRKTNCWVWNKYCESAKWYTHQ